LGASQLEDAEPLLEAEGEGLLVDEALALVLAEAEALCVFEAEDEGVSERVAETVAVPETETEDLGLRVGEAVIEPEAVARTEPVVVLDADTLGEMVDEADAEMVDDLGVPTVVPPGLPGMMTVETEVVLERTMSSVGRRLFLGGE
jgi:hypothetical protein